MDNIYGIDSAFYFFIGLLCICIIIVFFSILFVKPFMIKRENIKIEMERTAGTGEYKYWEQELRRLYFGGVPLTKVFTKRK